MNNAPRTNSLQKERAEHHVSDHRAIGDNIADDATAISAANTLGGINGGDVIFLPGTYKISSNINLTQNCVFYEGAMISIDSGKTVTITANIQAGSWQIFSGAGTVSFTGNKKLKEVCPEWWGAKADGGTTNNATAIQSCLTAAGTNEAEVKFGIGTYYYTSLTAHCCIIPDNVTVKGCGDSTILQPKSVFGLSAYIASGTRSNVVIKDLKIAPHADATYANAGISVYKATKIKIENVNVSAYPACAINIALSNDVRVDKCTLSCKVTSTPTIVYITAGCHNIKITGCKFGYGYYGVLGDGTITNPTYDISITDNYYDGDAGNLADAAFIFVTPYCYQIMVEHNFIRNAITGINTHNGSDISCSINDIIVPATTTAHGIYVYGDIAARIKNVNICNNKIRRSDLLTTGIDIFLGRIDGLSVSGNICDVGKSTGIQVNNITGGVVSGNTVKLRESGYIGIQATAAPNIIITNNNVAETNVYGIYLGPGGAGEVIDSDNAIVQGNVIKKTSAASNYGAIYIDTAINCVVRNNVFSSTYNYGEYYFVNGGSITNNIINIKDVGAVGDDSADDTAAIQRAISIAERTTPVGVVEIPVGIFKTTSVINILNTNIRIIGASEDSSIIKCYGIGHGIYILNDVGNSTNEGVNLHNFRLQKGDNTGTGYGIYINGGRRTIIDRVWIGGFYNTNTLGFARGVFVTTNPAYYVTIQHCHIQRCTYGVYLEAGANDTRITKNDIWYGDYSVYIDGGQSIRITDNTCENYVYNAIYVKDCDDAYVGFNYFEATGLQSARLVGTTKNARFIGNTYASQLYDKNDILDESDFPDKNRLEQYHIPLMLNEHPTPYNKDAGVIDITRTSISPDSTDYGTDYFADNVRIKALVGDLVLKSEKYNRAVDIQSALEAKSISSSFAGTGVKYGNLLLYSEDFNSWTKAGGTTVSSNACVAPDGTITADLIDGIHVYQSVSSASGDVINCSVWLKSDIEQVAYLLSYTDSGSSRVGLKYIKLTTEWKRYSITGIAYGALTAVTFRIVTISDATTPHPIYAWGAQVSKYASVTGTDNSGVDDKAFLMDTTKDFRSQGIDVGGIIELFVNSIPLGELMSVATITDINTRVAYNTGATAQPTVGATITGNNASTAVVVAVVTSSGTWAGNNAAGYIEVNEVNGAIGSAATFTFTGGSFAPTAVSPNCIIRHDGLNKFTGNNSPSNIDNGMVYFLCPSYMRVPAPYCATTTTNVPMATANFGTQTIAIKSVIYNSSPIADTADGEKAIFTAGASLVFGDVCYMGSDGKMEKAKADAIATAQVMAICLETIAENATGLFLLKGYIHLHSIAPGWSLGSALPIYLSDTAAGGYDQVAPADTDECIIKIGVAIVADVLYFNPDSTIVVHV